jgi:hypothetical protein
VHDGLVVTDADADTLLRDSVTSSDVEKDSEFVRVRDLWYDTDLDSVTLLVTDTPALIVPPV